MTNALSIERFRSPHLFGALAALSIVLGACSQTPNTIITGGIADDYRLRHPVAITEATQSLVVFVGQARGNLTATQRDDVMGLARNWVREGTSAIIVNVPVDTPNARVAAAVSHEVRSVLTAGGVPARAITTYHYHPEDLQALAPIKLNYTRMAATAGPCGVWPDDLGPNIANPDYNENKQYYNFGCSTQRNLAVMVANPSDLVQPRAETPAYTMRRTEGFEHYRKGEPTSTVYPDADKAKLSDAGK